MMSYINETDFVVENKKLVYPEIVTDGLQLYYDAKGKRDTDYHRDTMLDMSGNKNHGKLHNFAYEKHSGYKDGLVFDYIDDKLVRPTLNLKPDDFTFMLNGNIISFSPDGTVKRVQDGEVIESKGFNLVRNGDFGNGTTGWIGNSGEIGESGGIGYTKVTGVSQYSGIGYSLDVIEGHKYYTSAKMRATNSKVSFLRTRFFGMDISDRNLYNPEKGKWYTLENISTPIETARKQILTTQNYVSNEEAKGKVMEMAHLTVIDLTKTFGAGNEPTKEQMGEIINRFGFIPNAQDLIDRVEYKGNDLGDMENIIDGLYKTDILSGEEVYTDKADDSVAHVDIDGNSYQSDIGRNITTDGDFSNGLKNWAINGTVTSNNIDGMNVVKLTGTGLGFFQYPSRHQVEGLYEISFKAKSVGDSSNVRCGFLNNGVGASRSFAITREWEKYTFRTSVVIPTGSIYQFYANNNTGEGLYITGIAVKSIGPSPDYPIEIHSLNDFDVVSSVGKENLLKDSQREWKSSSEYVAPSYNLNEIFDKYPIGQTYTISFDAKSDDPSKKDSLQFYSNLGTTPQNKYVFATRGFTGLTTEYQRFSHTITPKLSADPSFPKSGMSFYGQYDTGNIPTIRNIKIELGTTATPYSVSPKDIVGSDNHNSIDKINLLLDEPLRSVGNVKDRLFRDSDGLWKVERNVYEHVFNGEESFLQYSVDSQPDIMGYYTTIDMLNPNIKFSPRTLINTLNGYNGDIATGGSLSVNYETYSFIGRHFKIAIKKERLGQLDTNGFKVWLEEKYKSNKPVVGLFSLTTPTIENLSQDLQDKLNNLRSFEDSNYVYTVLPNEDNYLSDKLRPTLHAKFLYNNWYKEDRVINNLMIYNRALTNEEMLQNYKMIKRRWGM